MNNSQIIINEAIASGYYTKEQIEELAAEGKMPEFHTYAIWKNVFGMVPKRGSKGWETRLWRRKNKKPDTEEESEGSDLNKSFYLTKSFLFHISQMEKLQEEVT